MDTFDLGAASEAELEAENQRLMEARAAAETGFKTAQTAIAVELDRRALAKKFSETFGATLSEEQRVGIIGILKGV